MSSHAWRKYQELCVRMCEKSQAEVVLGRLTNIPASERQKERERRELANLISSCKTLLNQIRGGAEDTCRALDEVEQGLHALKRMLHTDQIRKTYGRYVHAQITSAFIRILRSRPIPPPTRLWVFSYPVLGQSS